jgi:hypothetical protein
MHGMWMNSMVGHGVHGGVFKTPLEWVVLLTELFETPSSLGKLRFSAFVWRLPKVRSELIADPLHAHVCI